MRLPRFLSIAHLKTWLRSHPDGQVVTESLLSDRLAQRERALVVLHSDGWVECYGSPGVDIVLAGKPHATTPAAGAMAEEYLDLTLPRPFADLYWPNKLKKFGKCSATTLYDIAESRKLVSLIKEVQDGQKRARVDKRAR